MIRATRIKAGREHALNFHVIREGGTDYHERASAGRKLTVETRTVTTIRNKDRVTVGAAATIPAGKATIRCEFTGKIAKVTVDIKEMKVGIREAEDESRSEMAQKRALSD